MRVLGGTERLLGTTRSAQEADEPRGYLTRKRIVSKTDAGKCENVRTHDRKGAYTNFIEQVTNRRDDREKRKTRCRFDHRPPSAEIPDGAIQISQRSYVADFCSLHIYLYNFYILYYMNSRLLSFLVRCL